LKKKKTQGKEKKKFEGNYGFFFFVTLVLELVPMLPKVLCNLNGGQQEALSLHTIEEGLLCILRGQCDLKPFNFKRTIG